MNDFGYDSNGVAAIRSPGHTYWVNARSSVRFDSNITPVRVVGPGQVAVDSADLKRVLDVGLVDWIKGKLADVEERFVAALAAADVQDSRTDTETEHAEPESDSGQGEKPKVHNHGPAEGRGLDCPERVNAYGNLRGACLDETPDAEPASDTGQGEYGIQGRCPSCGGGSLFRGAGGYVTCSRSDCTDPDAATTILERTPAAEPVRATLPDTPWTTVRVTLGSGATEVWHVEDEGRWRVEYGAYVLDEFLARVVSYEVLAEPPKADSADTDAQEYERAYDELVADISDRAATRGRDEALAGFERAVRGVEQHLSMQPHSAPIEETLRLLASAIEREQGGDGR